MSSPTAYAPAAPSSDTLHSPGVHAGGLLGAPTAWQLGGIKKGPEAHGAGVESYPLLT